MKASVTLPAGHLRTWLQLPLMHKSLFFVIVVVKNSGFGDFDVALANLLPTVGVRLYCGATSRYVGGSQGPYL
jgi:hypothetical protein